MTNRGWQFWVDRGGTFTDLVARRPDGALIAHKLLSENLERYADAAIQGIRDLLGVTPGKPIPVDQIEVVKMGTTVATNALIERKGGCVGLLATEGFSDVIEIGRYCNVRANDIVGSVVVMTVISGQSASTEQVRQ